MKYEMFMSLNINEIVSGRLCTWMNHIYESLLSPAGEGAVWSSGAECVCLYTRRMCTACVRERNIELRKPSRKFKKNVSTCKWMSPNLCNVFKSVRNHTHSDTPALDPSAQMLGRHRGLLSHLQQWHNGYTASRCMQSNLFSPCPLNFLCCMGKIIKNK